MAHLAKRYLINNTKETKIHSKAPAGKTYQQNIVANYNRNTISVDYISKHLVFSYSFREGSSRRNKKVYPDQKFFQTRPKLLVSSD